MSEENVEVVRRAYEAYVSSNPELALAYFDRACELDLRLRPDGKVFRGHEGVVEAARTWIGAWEGGSLEVEEFIDADNGVLVLARESGRGKGSGIEVEHPHITLSRIRNGKIVHVQGFLDRGQALKAAGLRE
jgi:uncharacterized protein